MFKFELNQTIFYMRENRVHSAPVQSRIKVENAHDDWDSRPEQVQLYNQFGKQRTLYNTCHGVITEHEAYASKEELLKTL